VTLNRPPILPPIFLGLACRLLIIYAMETESTQDCSGRVGHYCWRAHFKCHAFDVDKYCTASSHESRLTSPSYLTSHISASLKSCPSASLYINCVIVSISWYWKRATNDDSSVEVPLARAPSSKVLSHNFSLKILFMQFLALGRMDCGWVKVVR